MNLLLCPWIVNENEYVGQWEPEGCDGGESHREPEQEWLSVGDGRAEESQ